MKRTLFLAAGLGLTLLTGCVVTSVYPFYTARDVVFEPALVGEWADANSTNETKEVWQFQKAGERRYALMVADGGETNHFEAHLFRLKKQLFLDLCPTNRVDGHLPLHYVLRIPQIEPTLQTQPLAYGWLKELLDKNPGAIRHTVVEDKPGDTNNATIVLTADTRELQKFILKYANNTNAFPESTELKKR